MQAALKQILPETSVSAAPLKKVDAELQIVWAEVYAPDIPDSQGDFMSAETIQNMAYDFMKGLRGHNIDVGHSQELTGSYLVESFIARDGDPVFIPNSWVVGVKVPDPAIWELIKSGKLNGFSLDGTGVKVPTKLEYSIPDALIGTTSEDQGHSHSFSVKYAEDGSFIGGQTSAGKDGHVHKILRGTATEEAGGIPHSHRFSVVEGFINAAVVN